MGDASVSKKTVGCALTILGAVGLLFSIWFYLKQLLLDPKQASSTNKNWAVVFLVQGIIGIVLGLMALRKKGDSGRRQ